MTRDYVANDSDAITEGLRKLRKQRDDVLRCTCVTNGEEVLSVGCPIHGVPQPENNALQSWSPCYVCVGKNCATDHKCLRAGLGSPPASATTPAAPYLVCRHQFRVCQRPVQCARYGSCVVTPSSPACYVTDGCTMTLVCPTLGHCYRASAGKQAAQG